jgi:uncharacterized membrane protein YdjX (TVP38/TMEM64 family)
VSKSNSKPDREGWFLNRRTSVGRIVYVGVAGVVIVLIGLWLWRRAPGLEEVLDVLQQAGPVPFFGALVLLPLVGIPTTPFYLLAGPAFGFGVSLIGTTLALGLQQSIAYVLSRHWLHGVLERFVARTRYQVPEVKPERWVRFTLLVRLAPGVPSWIKNYLVGLARVPFGIFLGISWPIAVGYAASLILLGDAAFSRSWRELIGVALLVMALLVLRRLARTRNRSGTTSV